MPSPNWNDLPAELLLKIASSCSQTEGMMGVSKIWKAGLETVSTRLTVRGPELPLTLASRFTFLTSLDLQQCAAVSPESLEALQSLPLANLALKQQPGDFTEAISSALRSLSLARLELDLENQEGRFGFPFPEFTCFLGLPVVSLRTYNSAHCEADALPLQSLPLTDLTLWGEFPDDCDLLGILRGKSLTSLELSENFERIFSDKCLEALRGMPLKALILGNCDDVTDEGLEVLKGMQLTALDISSNDANSPYHLNCLSDAGLQVLRGMPLTKLMLESQVLITGAGLEMLREMPLTMLSLSWTELGDADIVVLKGLPLTDLRLQGLDITDAGLDVLVGMPLTFLNLSCNYVITGSGLMALLSAPLKEIELDDCSCLDSSAVTRFWRAQTQYQKDELEATR